MNTVMTTVIPVALLLSSTLQTAPVFAQATAAVGTKTNSISSSTTAKKTAFRAPSVSASPNAASQFSAMQEGKVWLSLDVVEHQYSASGSEVGKEKYRSDIEIQIIDSATNRSSSARSGETVPLQARHTYYILLSEVPQRYGMTTKIAGQQTQVLRAPKNTSSEDILLERKFVLSSQPLSGSARAPVGTPSSGTMFPGTIIGAGTVRPPFMTNTAHSPFGLGMGMSMGANYYVIQYCSLKSQEEALQAKSYLLRSGVRDARVEVFVDKFGQAYYRIRSGSYPEIPMAKSTIENILWKNRQYLGLKQKPIIVKAGV